MKTETHVWSYKDDKEAGTMSDIMSAIKDACYSTRAEARKQIGGPAKKFNVTITVEEPNND